MLSKFKKWLKINEARTRQKIKNRQTQIKIYWFLKLVYPSICPPFEKRETC